MEKKIIVVALTIILMIAIGIFGYNVYNSYIDGLYDEAIAAFEADEYVRAREYFIRLINLDEKNTLIYEMLIAASYYQEDKIDEALQVILPYAEELDDLDYLAFYALILSESGDEYEEQAIEVLRSVIEEDPKDIFNWHLLGELLRYREPEEAVMAKRKVIELDPTNAEAYFDLGDMLEYEAGDYEAAAEIYLLGIVNNAVESEDMSPEEALAEMHYRAGVMLFELGRYAETEEHFLSYLNYDSEHGGAWYYVASCRALMGKEEAMYEALGKAIKDIPEYSNIVLDDLDFAAYLESERFREFVQKAKGE